MAQTTKKTNSYKSTFQEKKPLFAFAFSKENYILMIIGIVVLALGYILLIGGGSKDPDTFSYSLFNARRLVFAPIFIIGGLVIEIFAIMHKPKAKDTNQE